MEPKLANYEPTYRLPNSTTAFYKLYTFSKITDFEKNLAEARLELAVATIAVIKND